MAKKKKKGAGLKKYFASSKLSSVSCTTDISTSPPPTPSASSTPNQSMPGLTTSQPSGQPSPFADSPSPSRCVKYSALHRVRKALQEWTTSHPYGRKGKHTLHHSEQEEYGPTCSWSGVFFYGRLWCMEGQPLTSDSNDKEWEKDVCANRPIVR